MIIIAIQQHNRSPASILEITWAGEPAMKISITYCAKWNYLPRASSLGDELKDKFGADIELTAGSGGVFEIFVDGKEIFSKAKLRRFPNPGEIIDLINAE